MLKNIFSLFLVSFCLGSLSAQTFNVNINPYPVQGVNKTSAGDSLRILAVMVNFQADKDEATFGNGVFGTIYTKDYGTSIIDPLPHDKAYFDAHLEFVKNYFEKSSSGKLKIVYNVLPDTVTVSKTMRNYSPPAKSSDFTSLGNLSKEVWTIVKTKFPNINFGDYDIFTIFHAGVGRDVSLPGSLGNERDLPSVYLSDKALKDIFGSNLQGLPANAAGTYNSMIIPETESREFDGASGNVLFELSINGLLVASVASHLGLPDLFDTETGLSAVGRFGLMDGQSIFAYNGVFPPEPSAWEKIFLGWITPDVINPVNLNVTLAAQLAASASDTTVLKVPINSSEYYLLENRQRDVLKDGAKITYSINGASFSSTFEKDTAGFLSTAIDSLSGVITDVDEFDWALPGSGIVIWHIDENIINARLDENKINADKNNRGVDVEEADGVQDIGETYFDVFGQRIVAEGGQQDMWYAGNNSPLYKNRFSYNTRPNTYSNKGANSLITISGFTANADRMSFNVTFGDSIITPLVTRELDIPYAFQGLTSSGSGNNLDINIVAGSLLYDPVKGAGEVSPLPFSDFKLASLNQLGTLYKVGARGSKVNILTQDSLQAVDIQRTVSAPPVVTTISGNPVAIVGTAAGSIYTINLVSLAFSGQDVFGKPVQFIAAGENNIASATSDSVFFNRWYSGFEGDIRDIALAKDASGSYNLIVLYGTNQFRIIPSNRVDYSFSVQSADTIKNISLADLKNDGSSYIIYTNGNTLQAVNLTGASGENFSFNDPAGVGFTGTPVSADFEGDHKDEVIAYTKDGRIFAVDGGSGKIIPGFPLSTGLTIVQSPVIFNYNGKTSLAAVCGYQYEVVPLPAFSGRSTPASPSDVNYIKTFYSWVISSDTAKLTWPQLNGFSSNNSFAPAPGSETRVTEFFPSSRVYNYPNPVEGNQTTIHYYVDENSKINIKIFDLAGSFVDELNADAAGGFDGEITWNVSGIQSGVYLARVEATSVTGKTENNVIKIAVVK